MKYSASAQATARWMRENGGLITEADFAAYAFKRRTPLETTYHGRRIVGMPPPSSGGVHVAQILNILEAKGPVRTEDATVEVAAAARSRARAARSLCRCSPF